MVVVVVVTYRGSSSNGSQLLSSYKRKMIAGRQYWGQRDLAVEEKNSL